MGWGMSGVPRGWRNNSRVSTPEAPELDLDLGASAAAAATDNLQDLTATSK